MMMGTKEVWVDIKGFEDRYQVSNRGLVRAKRRNNTYYYKKLQLSDGGHTVYLFSKAKTKTYSVARLVAEHFVPNPDGLPICYRKDGDILNDYADNLAWGNRSDVVRKKHLFSVIAKLDNGYITNVYRSIRQAAADTGVSASCIRRCLLNLSTTAGNSEWSYIDIVDNGDVKEVESTSNSLNLLLRCRRCDRTMPIKNFKQNNTGRKKLMHVCNRCINDEASLRLNVKRLLSKRDDVKLKQVVIREYESIYKLYPRCKNWAVMNNILEKFIEEIKKEL